MRSFVKSTLIKDKNKINFMKNSIINPKVYIVISNLFYSSKFYKESFLFSTF